MIHGEDIVLNVIVDIIKIAEITSVEKSYCGMSRSILRHRYRRPFPLKYDIGV